MTDKELQDSDYQWFFENTESLFMEYGSKFAAIKNKIILGIYDNFDEAIDTTMKQEELGTFLVQEILEDRNTILIYDRAGCYTSDLNKIRNITWDFTIT